MKLFLTSQIREIDRLTIEKEPVSSINLMECAADAIFRWFASNISAHRKIIVFAGPGNNGGDGLALARLLVEAGYYVEVYLLESSALSPDCLVNLDRLKKQGISKIYQIKSDNDFPLIGCDSYVVDALFGSGLSRPLSDLPAKLIKNLNDSGAEIISIDIPSGLFGDENPVPNSNSVVQASITLTLQFPKLSFFFAENEKYIGKSIVLPIGLNEEAISSTFSPYHYADYSLVTSLLRIRSKFSHKGDFGHCLIIAGSKGMIGATVLASTSCIKSGSGLVTAHVPKIGYQILQQSVPEVMVEVDENEYCFTSVASISKYSAIAIGPGLDKSQLTVDGVRKLMKDIRSPLVIDADGLNILAENPDLMNLIQPNTVLTPHPGEFDRLFGKSDSYFHRFKRAVEMAEKYNTVIVLKGAYTQIICPDGKTYFNSTGNSGMATGGSGDVLTGIITSFLGQGYNPVSSSILGVYIHGLAGDIAAEDMGENSITASDIICYLGDAFNLISISKND